MTPSLRPLLLTAACAFLATGCGGGGTGSSVPGAPSPTAAPTMTPTAAQTTAPVAVGNSTAPPLQLSDDASFILGASTPSTVVDMHPNASPVDGIACSGAMALQQHYHVHVSVFVNGQQQAVPTAIGQYHPKLLKAPYYYETNSADPSSCLYDMHTHAPDGIVHVETASATAQYNLGEFLDIWGVTLGANNFGSYTGPTRVYVTDEDAGTAGSHPVTDVTGTDPHALTVRTHLEYTIEVGAPLVPTPNYTFASGL